MTYRQSGVDVEAAAAVASVVRSASEGTVGEEGILIGPRVDGQSGQVGIPAIAEPLMISFPCGLTPVRHRGVDVGKVPLPADVEFAQLWAVFVLPCA